ncbi:MULTISPECIES: NADH-quinone oxidoreductase subunit B family protein [Acidiphilium]|jgi:Ni,Fe-hydrogenase III small subunit|uniref:Putative NADH ubiquinone oxidoreductase n=1 Tax=Acidiphilium multivorum (strain DSM 11245 / JCM 8867 / NBRC 100883 / AIU 301) TaxID=926570 RepID=F0IXR8_ACIMA|nr:MULTISPECIES: hydrogenase [Acidiphilium]MBU6356053.1 hydrogenase [Rhodospirillales bacterium]KDM65165.1 putative NADH ubiquinone oxidoreductase [Acidiphilium sp. JA12-A1]MDE2327865.1 hydrogenase [Rhodospirillales bacterium]UNC15540.1 hydrogenase [Acidiphilium multivorum]BAJ80578.1 putative NADH ubiquinone oxidoreductase [Acidiphilium multivorum AIU301]
MDEDDPVRVLSARLAASGQALLGRSLAVRHVDAGSCGGCEIEIAACRRLRGGMAAQGIAMVEDLRAADILLVTGVATRNLAEAVRKSLAGMAPPRFVVAAGDCALDGGVFKGVPAVLGGVQAVIPVDLLIAGCPPAPRQILAGLVALVEANAREPRRARVEPHA